MTSQQISPLAQRRHVILTETHRGIETHSGHTMPGGYQAAVRLVFGVPLGHGISDDRRWHVGRLDLQL